MISSINYRGLIKLVLHYRANNSFRPSPPANSDTQITIQSNLTNLFDSASTFREHFTKISRYFSQQFLPAENQMNHALIWKQPDTQTNDKYLSGKLKCTLLRGILHTIVLSAVRSTTTSNWPMRGQYPHHMITLDQWEASIQYLVSTN